MTAPFQQTNSVPQTPNGVPVDGGGSSPIPVAPTPGTAQSLSWNYLTPAGIGNTTIWTDVAPPTRTLVKLIAEVPNGCQFTLLDGISGNFGASEAIFGVNGETLPGLLDTLLNAKMQIGPDLWVAVVGVALTQLWVSYTGSQL